MEQIVVKSEMPNNSEILLFYVDENGGNEEGVLTTVESIEHQAEELQQDNSYVIEDVGELANDYDLLQATNQKEHWTEDDIKRLLVFYNDNKQTFISGTTKKEHLWTVACKTMLVGKNPNSCETQLQNLKASYIEISDQLQKGVYTKWPYFEICHQIFQDDYDNDTEKPVQEYEIHVQNDDEHLPMYQNQGFVVVKKANNRSSSADEKVETMLNLYLKHKKSFQQDYWRRGLWETIAMEIGEEDGEYWQKRFLNYKQHYIRLLDKQRESGAGTINWPYFSLFEKIFEDDLDFRKKYLTPKIFETQNISIEAPIEWDTTEKTVLVKYCFDCFDEFQDHTIPKSFLWNEIGRLLDKTADACKQKYEELKSAHLDKYINEGYDIRSRIPIEIVYDNIISKEIELEVAKNESRSSEHWKTEEIDELAHFFYQNIEMYKDPLCHFVCWAAVAKKLKRDLGSCRGQWEDLITLYKSILADKKENPDMQIDWRYIELFDRIFDYGMDETLLAGHDRVKAVNDNQGSGKVGVKKVKINLDDSIEEITDDDESFDEAGYGKGSKRHSGDSKAFKILEFYQKNKDKFNTTKRNKHSLWEVLAKQIGISAIKCSHRLRNLKQVYTAYVQREINKPEMPILWPYYALCKKVFGYRAIKTKLKSGKLDFEDTEDWSAKEIKLLINYFSRHFNEIENNIDDIDKWSELGKELGKSRGACKDKFIELRKSYRKLKTMRSRNPDVKISWKYFNMFAQIYTEKEGQDSMEVELLDPEEICEQEEDDYQCIIVMSEGEEMETAPIEVQEDTSIVPKPVNKWNKRTKKWLLILYINYIRTHKGKEIIPKDMWAEIAAKLHDKTPLSCRKMFAKLKANHKQDEHDVNKKKTPYYTLLEKIVRLKPKFAKSKTNQTLTDGRTYKDVALPDDKVEMALTHYLQHIQDFNDPKFEKKYLWTELASIVSEPVTKVFNKINYLKQYNTETGEVVGEKTQFAGLLKEIMAKEMAVKLVIENQPKPVINEAVPDEIWSDDETEKLLEWYLSNLDKFKNPKYVRSYLWMEAASILNKSAIVCSKKMYEIRTEYRNMVRERNEELNSWRFHDLCQKIYGTGKKGNSTNAS